jgi:CheY-like chemotaxis protein
VKIKILLVEDSPTQAQVSHDDLQTISSDIEIEIAGTAHEAMRQAQAFPSPDLIILDIHLPDGSGLEVCRRLKSFGHTRHIPIVVYSGEPLFTQRQDAYAAGADQYITKGATGDSTLRLVASTLLREKLRRLPRLGEALVELGYLKVEDLKKAIDAQRRNPNKMLGQLLVEMKLATNEQVLEALQKQLKTPGDSR